MMNSWVVMAEVSMGIELILGAILIMVVNYRYKHNSISRKTFHIQNLQILILVFLLVATEFASIKFAFLRNRFLLIAVELIIVFLFFLLDRKFNGRESFM